ncbi:MAG: hypothetical protein KKG33_04750 [candidate division Zixibacteria bacterium]|nr:hypothetical protein [candidate division Zixibacteria bacterium]
MAPVSAARESAEEQPLRHTLNDGQIATAGQNARFLTGTRPEMGPNTVQCGTQEAHRRQQKTAENRTRGKMSLWTCSRAGILDDPSGWKS